MHLTPATAAVLATLLAEGFTAATVLAHYTHAADTEQTQTFEVAAWYTRYRVLGGQTVPVYAELTERYQRGGDWLGYEATLAALQVEEHCPSLFGGCVVPGAGPGTDFQAKPATRDLSGQGFAFPGFAAQPGVVLTPEGERFLALTQPLAQAVAQARAEQEARFQARKDAEARAIGQARKPRAGERVMGRFTSGRECAATVTRDWDGNAYGFVDVRSDATATDRSYTGSFRVVDLVYLDAVPA
jgi:hypothetical protein